MSLSRVGERTIIIVLSVKLVLVGLFLNFDLSGDRAFEPRKAQAQTKAAPVKIGPGLDKAGAKKGAKPAKPAPVKGVKADKGAVPKRSKAAVPTAPTGLSPAGREVLGVLAKRREQLRQEREKLVREKTELKRLKAEIDGQIKRLNKLQTAIKQLLAKEKDRRKARIAHLVRVMSNMQAEPAARLCEVLDVDLVVRVFLQMQGRTAGRIMAQIKPRRAAQISTRLALAKKKRRVIIGQRKPERPERPEKPVKPGKP